MDNCTYCVHSQGYWKNHPIEFRYLDFAPWCLCEIDPFLVFNTPPRGNAWIIAAKQYYAFVANNLSIHTHTCEPYTTNQSVVDCITILAYSLELGCQNNTLPQLPNIPDLEATVLACAAIIEDFNSGNGEYPECPPCPFVCDALETVDDDEDDVPNYCDNCPFVSNANQTDCDGDGTGDVCDEPDCGNGCLESPEACDDGLWNCEPGVDCTPQSTCTTTCEIYNQPTDGGIPATVTTSFEISSGVTVAIVIGLAIGGLLLLFFMVIIQSSVTSSAAVAAAGFASKLE